MTYFERYGFKRPSGHWQKISPKTIQKTLKSLPDEFTFAQAKEQMQKICGGLSPIKDGRVRNRLYYLLKAKAIESTPDPKDGRRVIYKKLNPMDK